MISGDIVLKGGPCDGATIKVDSVTNVCYPVMVKDQAGAMMWITAVYIPDETLGTCVWSRNIQFADNQTVTPIDQTLFEALLDVPGTLLELGSGTSTWWLHKHRQGRVISVEDSPTFYGLFSPFQTQILAPQVSPMDHAKGIWSFYDPNILGRLLPQVEYSALLIDGPDGNYRIKGFTACQVLFNPHVDWFFDDYDALVPGARDDIDKLAVDTGRKLEVHRDCKKYWAVLRAKPPVSTKYTPLPIAALMAGDKKP
jgi:hypothetical protein